MRNYLNTSLNTQTMTKNTSKKQPMQSALLLMALCSALSTIPAQALTIQSVSRQYDALSRLSKETYPDGRWVGYEYDANGNRTALIESMPGGTSRTTRYTYDGLNRLKTITDALNGITKFSYDSRDNLVSVTDPRNLTTSYTYNGFDDLLKRISPDTGTTTFTVSPTGQVQTEVDARSKTLSSSYDNAGRLIQRNDGDQTITYSWDSASNGNGLLGQSQVVQGSTLNATEAYSYDTLGQPLGKTQLISLNGGVADQRSVGYSYLSNGHLSRINYPSGNYVDYSYDSNGHVQSLSVNGQPLLSGITWRSFGDVTSWTWGNGLGYARSYDQNGRLSSITNGTLLQKTLTWDVGNRITASTDPIATRSQTYSYDNVDRLTQTQRNTTTDNYSYDLNGNRKGNRWGSTINSYTYPASSNRLSLVYEITSTGSSTGSTVITRNLGYDAAGNQISDDRNNQSFVYNNAGRLIKATNLAGTTTLGSYGYNANGQRIYKQANGTTLYFAYDQSGHLLGEYDSSGAYQEHIWLGDTPVANLRISQVGQAVQNYYVLTDQLGTPRAVVDPTLDLATTKGRIVWRWEGEAFGNSPADDDADNNSVKLSYNLRFPGQYADKETGKNYNYFRDYDSSTGRYVESDPIGLKGGINTYGYVGGAPIEASDPLGLVTVPFYIPDSKVVNFVRDKAASLGRDLSKYSDKQILDFVEFVPKNVADDFKKSWDSRPDKGTPMTPELKEKNRREVEKEQKMIDEWLKLWKRKCQKK